MMDAVYLSVVAVFIFIIARKAFLPYLKKARTEKQSGVQQAREMELPCYKVIAFQVTGYATMHDLGRDVGYRLSQTLEEAADRGVRTFDRLEYMSAGDVLLILVRFPDKKVIYPAGQKEGVER